MTRRLGLMIANLIRIPGPRPPEASQRPPISGRGAGGPGTGGGGRPQGPGGLADGPFACEARHSEFPEKNSEFPGKMGPLVAEHDADLTRPGVMSNDGAGLSGRREQRAGWRRST